MKILPWRTEKTNSQIQKSVKISQSTTTLYIEQSSEMTAA